VIDARATIPGRIHAAALAAPDTAVIVHSATRPDETTFGQLYDESLRMAAGLRQIGIRAGDVVAVQLPNWRECFVTYAAVWLTGAVLLPIVPIYGPREVGFILAQSGARAFVAAGSVRGRDNAALVDGHAHLPALAHRIVVGESGSASLPFHALTRCEKQAFESYVPADAAERCLLVYTSGTTSTPKGVVHTHATLLAEIDATSQLRGDHGQRVWLNAFPTGHIAGLLGILRMLTTASPTVTMDAWNPKTAARLICDHTVAASGGAPIHLAGLLDAAEQDGFDLSGLREYTTGAASVTAALIRRADRFGVTAFRSYGSTEHPTISSGTSDDPLDKRADTDGRLTPFTRIRLVDDDGTNVKPGMPGEILTLGPELFAGYSDTALTETSMADGWFRTGDIGYLDAEGYLCITDRKKDIIVRGGENISSKEVEDVLMDHPAVCEAAAVGVPDERFGERVCACVVLYSGQTLDLRQVRDHFDAAGLARQKTPEQLKLVAELPRTASGKVQKHLLRQQLSALVDAAPRRQVR
jgi:cyclohexanecarboxylate-CoA ligase